MRPCYLGNVPWDRGIARDCSSVAHEPLTKQMKNPDRKTVSRLEKLPNIGKALAGHLRLIGIHHPQHLINKDPYQLYDELCNVTGEKHDPCVIDVFLAVVDFMEGGDPVPWWSFTDERKKYIAEHQERT